MDTPNIKHPDLYSEIVAYCEANGVRPTRFGKDALGDPAFLNSLERGRELRAAVPNSVKVAAGGQSLQFYNAISGGRYRSASGPASAR